MKIDWFPVGYISEGFSVGYRVRGFSVGCGAVLIPQPGYRKKSGFTVRLGV